GSRILPGGVMGIVAIARPYRPDDPPVTGCFIDDFTSVVTGSNAPQSAMPQFDMTRRLGRSHGRDCVTPASFVVGRDDQPVGRLDGRFLGKRRRTELLPSP